MKRIETILNDIENLHNQICINPKINKIRYIRLSKNLNEIKSILRSVKYE